MTSTPENNELVADASNSADAGAVVAPSADDAAATRGLANTEAANTEAENTEAENTEAENTEAEEDAEEERDEPPAKTSSARGKVAEEPAIDDEASKKNWYILKVAVNREESIRDALLRRVKIAGLEDYFGEIVVPTEDVREYTKSGKPRVVKRKLFPGYLMAYMSITEESWFLVRETPGIGDFTGSGGKPTPMEQKEVDRIIKPSKGDEGAEGKVRTAIPFKMGDRVRVKDGYFQNFEGDVDSIDEAHGRITVMINIFGRPTPVELEHWQVELL